MQCDRYLSGNASNDEDENVVTIKRLAENRPALKVIAATAAELTAHASRLDGLDKSAGGTCTWRELEGIQE